MTQYPVYRTTKGNLSFNPNGEVVYTIRAKSKSDAQMALKNLKQIDNLLTK
jgi:hypothetical protein